MTSRERFLLGAAGAVSPSLINILIIDATAILADLTILVALAYALRLLVLSVVGGAWASLQGGTADSRARAFQLGIVAPAIIVSLVNGSQVPRSTAWWAPPSVAAAERPAACRRPAGERPLVWIFAPPSETPYEQAKRGLTGRPSERTWFVIVRFARTFEQARALAEGTARTLFPLAIYCAPPDRHPETPFALVAGKQLNRSDAEAILKDAIRLGFLEATLYDAAPKAGY